MKLLENKECIVISWDRQGHVFGLKVRRGKDRKLTITNSGEADDADNSFPAKLADVYSKLAPREKQLIILGGYVPGSVCFETKMPKMAISDLAEAIKYELSRFLPCEEANLYFGFRIISTQELAEQASTCRVRVFAVIRKHWDDLVNDIANANLKTDFLLHPFLALDPLLAEDESIYLAAVHPDYLFVYDPEDGLRKAIYCGDHGFDGKEAANRILKQLPAVNEKQLEFDGSRPASAHFNDGLLNCLLLAYYGTGNEIQKDQPALPALPARLIPERFRGLRISFWFLTVVVAFMLLSYLGRIWIEDRERYQQLKKESASLDLKIAEFKRKNKKAGELKDLMDMVYGADLGNSEILHGLHKLTQIIPKGIWIVSLSTRGILIDMTLWAAPEVKDDTGFLDNVSNIFQINDSPQKRRNQDNSRNIYLSLEYLPLRKEKVSSRDKLKPVAKAEEGMGPE